MAMVLQLTTFLQQYLYSRPDVKALTKEPDAVKLGVIGGSAMINAASIFHPVETHPGAKIVALASRQLKDAEDAAKKYNVPKAYGSYEELLADPEIEDISLPNGLHGEWAIKSLQAGKHVLLEKPFTSNGPEARAVFKAAEASGKSCVEAFHWQFHPAAHVVKSLLASGKFGDIQRTYSRMVTPKNTIPASDIRWQWALGGGGYVVPKFWQAPAIEIECEKATIYYYNFMMPHIYHYIAITDKVTKHTTYQKHYNYGPKWKDVGDVHWSTYQLEAFVDKIKGKEPKHWITQEDTIAQMETIDAIYEKTGLGPRPVSKDVDA
ncbi:hypothetical protein IAU60_006332 [Kwoniella sp. DSM 27419]